MRYFVVTGAAGFIGSNLVKRMNERGADNILAVDNLTRGDKYRNLVDCELADYCDKTEFMEHLQAGSLDGAIEAVLHQGACSDTMEHNGHYMMANNYRYSLRLLDYCLEQELPYIYASSAAVYGGGPAFKESRDCEAPLNVYGYSKFLFDQIVRRRLPDAASPVVGLRYFNVYGPREQHKGRMASVAFHLFHQFRSEGRVKLFEGCAGYADGEQRRDFVFVADVVDVNLFFLEHPDASGVFNVGTGRAQTFNDVAVAAINACRAAEGTDPLGLSEMRERGLIQYIPFPPELRGKYQSYTQADVAALRRAGYRAPFADVANGVSRYVTALRQAGD